MEIETMLWEFPDRNEGFAVRAAIEYFVDTGWDLVEERVGIANFAISAGKFIRLVQVNVHRRHMPNRHVSNDMIREIEAALFGYCIEIDAPKGTHTDFAIVDFLPISAVLPSCDNMFGYDEEDNRCLMRIHRSICNLI